MLALPRTVLPTATREVAALPAGAPGHAWSHPAAGLRVLGFGEAERREGSDLRAVLAGLSGGAWLGSARFSGSWPGFGAVRFVRPRVLGFSEGGRHFLTAATPRELDEALRAAPALHAVQPLARRVADPAARRRWNALVGEALQEIDAGRLQKVVVARAIDVEASGAIGPHALLATLEEQNPESRGFLVRGDGGEAFVGATPETLCRVEDGLVHTEALAGSGVDPAALLESGKDLREHRWVVGHVVEALSRVAGPVQRRARPGVRTLPHLSHLHTPMKARLLPGRGVADVAAALFPTPAVNGVPLNAALKFLADHEGLERGLYAGLVGWVADGRAELSVALRCALLSGHRARLFVGAGIVAGSSAASEWDETELKAQALLTALGVRA